MHRSNTFLSLLAILVTVLHTNNDTAMQQPKALLFYHVVMTTSIVVELSNDYPVAEPLL